MFYKQEEPKHKTQSQAQQQSVVDLPEHMQALVDRKMQQLEQAMASYQSEFEKAQAQKRDYEAQFRKLRVDQRDLEAQKKRLLEDVEKQKAIELDKINKEKKALEQR